MKKLFLMATVFCTVMPLLGYIDFENKSKSMVAFEVLYSSGCDSEKGRNLQPHQEYRSSADCKTKKIFVSQRNADGSVKSRFSVKRDWRSNMEQNIKFEFLDDKINVYTVLQHDAFHTEKNLIKTYTWGHTE